MPTARVGRGLILWLMAGYCATHLCAQAPLSPILRVNSAAKGLQLPASVATRADGTALVAYSEFTDPQFRLVAKFLELDASLSGETLLRDSPDQSEGVSKLYRATSEGWLQATSYLGVAAIELLAPGGEIEAPPLVLNGADLYCNTPRIGQTRGGDIAAAVTCSHLDSDAPYGTYFRSFTAEGTPISPLVEADEVSSRFGTGLADLAVADDDTVMLSLSYIDSVTEDADQRGRLFSIAGVPLSHEFPISSSDDGFQGGARDPGLRQRFGAPLRAHPRRLGVRDLPVEPAGDLPDPGASR